ncbi:MAG: hypothetical protein R3E89_10450 [Thiolinea sp.]
MALPETRKIRVYHLRPEFAGAAEVLVPTPEVQPDGRGVVQVLDSLKTGDREELFDLIEAKLQRYIPEVEKSVLFPVRKINSYKSRKIYPATGAGQSVV